MRKPRQLGVLFFLISYSRADEVDSFIAERMRDLQIPGLSVAVLKDGKIIKTAGFGMANVETHTPATPETVYKTASLSKPFIAAAILLLAQENKVAVDDRVSKYLEDSPASWKEITLRHLLTHTSGIARDPPDYHPYREQPVMEVIRGAMPLPLSFPPGEKWLYSNVGYYLLAHAISEASGKPWNEFIADRFFAPAGMTSTRLTTTVGIVPHRARGYHRTNEGLNNAEDWIAIRPSGAFLSTILDLAKWDIFLDSQSPLTESTRRQMWTPAKLNNETAVDYGYGWYVGSFLGRARIHHDGQFPGFRADYERFEDDQLTVIVLANSDNAGLESLAIKIAGFYAPALQTPPFALSAAVASRILESGKAIEITVTAQDDGKAAPATVLEMEIWDAAGKPVYKQHQTNQNFAAGETRKFAFSWTPAKAGSYSVNVGAYGPKWTPSYAWKVNAAMITVNPQPAP